MTTTVSCPGKVLVIGGYAVLERPNRGLVVSTTARFHSSASLDAARVDETQPDGVDAEATVLLVEVESPQYIQSLRLSVSQAHPSGPLRLVNSGEASNSYVERSLGVALAAALALRQRFEAASDLRDLLFGARADWAFAEVMDILEFHFQFGQNAFSVGEVSNDVKSNQKSFRVLAVAKLFGLDDASTAKLWGEHHRAVVADPSGESHANLRAFLSGGLACVSLDSDGAAAAASSGSKRLLRSAINKEEFEEEAALAEAAAPVRLPRGVLRVSLKADNDFYSQQAQLSQRGLPYTAASLRALPRFLPCDTAEGVAKTGLGSSAAMVTSLTAAVLWQIFPAMEQVPESARLHLLHALAQLAHGFIQGKIGSGFDVCAAVHGSMQYTRFQPASLKAALDVLTEAAAAVEQEPKQGDVGVEAGEKALGLPAPATLLRGLWRLDHSVAAFQLPKRFVLMCGDVKGGSETPSMSRKILSWKATAQQPDGSDGVLWVALLAANEAVAQSFRDLDSLSEGDFPAYSAAVDAFAAGTCAETQPGAVARKLEQLRAGFRDVRRLLRAVGQEADVPVEPPCQTELCDATAEQPGVLACGVPGAGGFDAVFAVVVDSSREQVATFWERRPDDAKVCALLLEESPTHPGVAISHSSEVAACPLQL